MERKYIFSYTENSIIVSDSVTNEGEKSPYMILYHCNMGYPLLDEESLVCIPNNGVVPRNDHAAEFIDTALNMENPQADYEECCYYYDVAEKNGLAHAGIYSENIKKGVTLEYDKAKLPCFTEWKMMGKKDYVLGLEPGNCTPDGRDVLRKNGTLKFLEADETAVTELKFIFSSNKKDFENNY